MQHTENSNKFHYDRNAMFYAFRGMMAGLIALVAAYFLNIPAPYWAAMTAIIVIQPTRGLLIEKSLARILGTAAGSLTGFLLLVYTHSPFTLTIGLALWAGLCASVGNMLQGMRAYAAFVAGMTGTIVAMAGYIGHTAPISIALGRVEAIFLGILVSTALTFFFTERTEKGSFLYQLNNAVSETLLWVHHELLNDAPERNNKRFNTILMSITDLDVSKEAVFAASLRGDKRHVRRVLASILAILHTCRNREFSFLSNDEKYFCSSKVAHLNHLIAEELAAESEHTMSAIEQIRNCSPLLGIHIDTLMKSYSRLRLLTPHPRFTMPEIICTKDAFNSGLRATSALLLLGAIWYHSGYVALQLAMMSTAIMMSIFSAHDRPAEMLKQVIAGAAVGVMVSLLLRIFVVPAGTPLFIDCLVAAPILFIGMLALLHPVTKFAGVDALMFFIFIFQPGAHDLGTNSVQIAGGLSALGGIAVAMLFFRYFLPIKPEVRVGTHLNKMLNAVHRMASRPESKSQSKLYPHILQYLRHSKRSSYDHQTMINCGASILQLSSMGAKSPEGTALRELLTDLKKQNYPESLAQQLENIAMQSTETVPEGRI